MSIRQVEALGSDEISEWMAFDAEYGLPDEYFAVAQTCTLMNNLWSKKAAEAGDFVPYFRRARRQTVAEAKAIVMAMAGHRPGGS